MNGGCFYGAEDVFGEAFLDSFDSEWGWLLMMVIIGNIWWNIGIGVVVVGCVGIRVFGIGICSIVVCAGWCLCLLLLLLLMMLLI